MNLINRDSIKNLVVIYTDFFKQSIYQVFLKIFILKDNKNQSSFKRFT